MSEWPSITWLSSYSRSQAEAWSLQGFAKLSLSVKIVMFASKACLTYAILLSNCSISPLEIYTHASVWYMLCVIQNTLLSDCCQCSRFRCIEVMECSCPWHEPHKHSVYSGSEPLGCVQLGGVCCEGWEGWGWKWWAIYDLVAKYYIPRIWRIGRYNCFMSKSPVTGTHCQWFEHWVDCLQIWHKHLVVIVPELIDFVRSQCQKSDDFHQIENVHSSPHFQSLIHQIWYGNNPWWIVRFKFPLIEI